MRMTLNYKKELIEAWEGHIIRNTDIKSCKDNDICPLDRFFNKLKKEIKS